MRQSPITMSLPWPVAVLLGMVAAILFWWLYAEPFTNLAHVGFWDAARFLGSAAIWIMVVMAIKLPASWLWWRRLLWLGVVVLLVIGGASRLGAEEPPCRGETAEEATARLAAALDAADLEQATDATVVCELRNELERRQWSGAGEQDGFCWQACPLCGSIPTLDRCNHRPPRDGHGERCENWRTRQAVADRCDVLTRAAHAQR